MPLSAREKAAFARVIDVAVAPAPPLPPVNQTDAIAAFDRLLGASPRTHRLALRAAVLATARRPSLLKRLDPVRATAAMTYYGDPGVQRILGYDP